MQEPRNRVVQVRRFGGADELKVVDAPMPTAGRGEVRVRVLASSVVYTDVVIRRHLYPQTALIRPPLVLGYDVVGEIDQLGDGVSGFQLGDRVADLTVLGSNAAYCTLRVDCLIRVPAGVDAAEAAALILSWTTAYQLLHRAPGCSEASARSSRSRCTWPARRNLTRAPSLALAYIHREADHVQKDRPAHIREPRHARRRLALARGYWLYHSNHHWNDRLSCPAHCSGCKSIPWPDKANPPAVCPGGPKRSLLGQPDRPVLAYGSHSSLRG